MPGALFGSILSGYLSDLKGRKYVLYLADILFIVGAIIMASSFSIYLLIIGRVMIGVGFGICFVDEPIFIAEQSQEEIRGLMLGWYTGSYILGEITASCIVLIFIDV